MKVSNNILLVLCMLLVIISIFGTYIILSGANLASISKEIVGGGTISLTIKEKPKPGTPTTAGGQVGVNILPREGAI